VPRHLTTHATDEAGVFVQRGLPQGRYRFSAFDERSGIRDADVDVAENATVDVTIRLRG
jgi:hypothetical protein